MEPFYIIAFIAVCVLLAKSVTIVPQQHAYVIERLGRYYSTLAPGLNFIIPFIDRIAYKHSLKEVPLDVRSQVCITRDNTQLAIDGVVFLQVTDAYKASYGVSDYVLAITQLAQTTLRSIIGQMDMDTTFEERNTINAKIVQVIDDSAVNWGVKLLRYEIQNITPPPAILNAMQMQITADREKRAVIATSEGKKQEQINLAEGKREAAIAASEGERQAAINKATGEAQAMIAIANATAESLRTIANAINSPGGETAMNLKVAEQYVEAFSNLAKQGNTLIVPSNLSDMSSMISSALQIMKSQK